MRWPTSNWFFVVFVAAMAWMHLGHGGHGGGHDHAGGGATGERTAESDLRRRILARRPEDDVDSSPAPGRPAGIGRRRR